MDLGTIVYLFAQLLDARTIAWCVVGYLGLRFLARLAFIMAGTLHRIVAAKIDEAARVTGRRLTDALNRPVDPEMAALRKAWKREFQGSMSWPDFLRMNADVNRKR